MLSTREIQKRLRAIGRSLRPFQREAEELSQLLDAELLHLEDLSDEIPAHLAARYAELTALREVADITDSELQVLREDIARVLRPPPQVKRSGKRKAEEGTDISE